MNLFERVARNWEGLARRDPLWAICTDPDKKGGGWDAVQFYATGNKEIDAIWSFLEKNSFLPVDRQKALDFGCGMGRLTFPLARRFEKIVGVDVSATMIRKATEQNPTPDKINFLVSERPDLSLFEDGAFSFVYSVITLQHIPPAESDSYLREFLRVLKPGGVAVFQIPTQDRRRRPWIQRLRSWLRPRERLALLGIGESFNMDMFVKDAEHTKRLVSENKGVVLSTISTNHTDLSYMRAFQMDFNEPSRKFDDLLFVVGKKGQGVLAESVQRGETRTSILPTFSPRNRPMKAWGAFSKPSTIVSRYFIFPDLTHSASCASPSGKRSA